MWRRWCILGAMACGTGEPGLAGVDGGSVWSTAQGVLNRTAEVRVVFEGVPQQAFLFSYTPDGVLLQDTETDEHGEATLPMVPGSTLTAVVVSDSERHASGFRVDAILTVFGTAPGDAILLGDPNAVDEDWETEDITVEAPTPVPGAASYFVELGCDDVTFEPGALEPVVLSRFTCPAGPYSTLATARDADGALLAMGFSSWTMRRSRITPIVVPSPEWRPPEPVVEITIDEQERFLRETASVDVVRGPNSDDIYHLDSFRASEGDAALRKTVWGPKGFDGPLRIHYAARSDQQLGELFLQRDRAEGPVSLGADRLPEAPTVSWVEDRPPALEVRPPDPENLSAVQIVAHFDTDESAAWWSVVMPPQPGRYVMPAIPAAHEIGPLRFEDTERAEIFTIRSSLAPTYRAYRQRWATERTPVGAGHYAEEADAYEVAVRVDSTRALTRAD